MKPRHRQTASLSYRIVGAASLRRGAEALVATVMIMPLWFPVFAEQGATADEPAIPPGQEDLLLDMLGHGAALADCVLVDGQVKYTIINATYACSGGDIEYRLTHRSEAQPGTTATDQFALELTSGTPPRGFEEALVSVVRSKEAEFEWYWPGDDNPE